MNDDFTHDLDSELPSPRDDEPASLRQDILDELSDHLQCASRREQIRDGAGSTKTIQQRVLEKFGSPAAVARQLWFDWMWEKIAMQRLSITLMITTVLCCGAMLFFMWQATQNTQSALLASQQTQLEMLKQLEKLSNQPAPAPANNQPAEWNNLKIRLVYDDEAHTPIAGAEISAFGNSENNNQLEGIEEKTGADGVADLGTLLYGEYSFWMKLPNRMTSKVHTVTIRPGQDKLEEVVCPQDNDLEVSVDVKLPEFFADEPMFASDQIWYQVSCVQHSPSLDYGIAWEHDPTELGRPTTIWIHQNQAYPDIKLEEFANDSENKLPPELSLFPATCLKLQETGTSQKTTLLNIGIYDVNSVAMFVQRTSKEGETCLVGVPDVPMVFINDTNTAKLEDVMQSEEKRGPFGMEYSDLTQASQHFWSCRRFFKAFQIDQQIVGTQPNSMTIDNKVLKQTQEGTLGQTLNVNPYEPLMFWLASQMKADQQLGSMSATSTTQLKQGFEPQSLDVYKDPNGTPLETVVCLLNNTTGGYGGGGGFFQSSPKSSFQNLSEFPEGMTLVHQLLVVTTSRQATKLIESDQANQFSPINGFFVKPSEKSSFFER